MKRKLDILLLACISLLCFSCKKFSNGDVTERQYIVDSPFQVIELCDNVNVKLKHSDAANPAGKVIVKTGENLIDLITTKIEEQAIEVDSDYGTDTLFFNKLVIRNENTLDFLRPYDYTLDMTVYYDTLLKIFFNSNGIITTDTLRGYEYLTDFSTDNDSVPGTFFSLAPNLLLEIEGGSGELTVLTNCYRLITKYAQGTSNINVKGLVERAETFGDYESHGIINGIDLEANLYHRVIYYGTNTVYAKAFRRIIAKNDNIGRIFYARYAKPGKVIQWGHDDPVAGWIPTDTIDTVFFCPLNVNSSGQRPENILDTIISRP
jgi:hypothetical protein